MENENGKVTVDSEYVFVGDEDSKKEQKEKKIPFNVMKMQGITEEIKKMEDDRKASAAQIVLDESNEVPDLDDVVQSEGFINRFMGYVKTNLFTDHCQQIADVYNIPRIKVAKTAFTKILGTAGDVLLIGCTTIESLVYKFLDVAYIVLKKGVNMICSLAKAIFRMITLDYTCVEGA